MTSKSSSPSGRTERPRRKVHYPWILTPAQWEILQAAERFLVLVAGRRWGKTILAVAWLVLKVLRSPPGSLGYYVLPFRNQAKDIAWEPLKRATRGFRIGKPNNTELSVTLRGGRRIVLKGADDPESLEGVGLVAVVLDEFGRMKLSAWEQSLKPTLAENAGPVLFIGKPRGFNHLKRFYDRGRGPTKRPAWRSWHYRTVDGGFVSPEEVKQAKDDLPPKIFRQEYEASFETLAGRIYEEFSSVYAPLGHIVSTTAVPAAFNRTVIGIDWGFTHPGVAVAIEEASGGLCYVTAEEYHAEFRVEQWEQCLARLKARFPHAEWRADPSRPDLMATYSQRLGIQIEGATNDVNDGLLEVMKMLHPRENTGPRLLVSDACPKVIEGLDGYVWDTNKDGEPLERPLKKLDDAPDAVRYAVMGIQRAYYVGPVDDDLLDS